MTIRTPSWLEAGSYPAENDRLLLQSILNGSPNTAPNSGIVGTTDFAVTASATPDMYVHVASGAAFIPGTETTTQGVYGFYSDASTAVLLAASDASNDRISLIVAQVLDGGYSGSSNLGQIVEVAGTPAASPVAPATPKNSIVLAQVRVPKGASSISSGNITDERVFKFVPAPLPTSTPKGILGLWSGPSSQTDITNTGATVISQSVNVIAGRWYRVTVSFNGTVITAANGCIVKAVAAGSELSRFENSAANATGVTLGGTTVGVWQASTTGTVTVQLVAYATASTGAFRMVANAAVMAVEDIGTGGS